MNFSEEVINWYQDNKRDLPWRKTQNPYIIWLSEVILQQTRVEQGMPYFYSFCEKYPTVADFAAASEDEILKLWQGLGYYSRGRNMHYTANMVMEQHEGYFPTSYDKLIKLKGIGEYTAAAISSFAGNEVKAVVDGNVFRLLSRYFNIDTPINSPKGKKEFADLAAGLIDPLQPALYNQAIMEFGSLQCKPKNPFCNTCPLQPGCGAFKSGKIQRLPVKLKAQKIKNRYFNYILAKKGSEILINKRGANDIWQNLYELPLIETDEYVSPLKLIKSAVFINAFGINASLRSITAPVIHVLSHQKLCAQFLEIENYEELFDNTPGWKYVDEEQLELLAQPKLIFSFLKKVIT